jgi:hypothetical protein
MLISKRPLIRTGFIQAHGPARVRDRGVGLNRRGEIRFVNGPYGEAMLSMPTDFFKPHITVLTIDDSLGGHRKTRVNS